jgi:hypothetical protein
MKSVQAREGTRRPTSPSPPSYERERVMSTLIALRYPNGRVHETAFGEEPEPGDRFDLYRRASGSLSSGRPRGGRDSEATRSTLLSGAAGAFARPPPRSVEIAWGLTPERGSQSSGPLARAHAHARTRAALAPTAAISNNSGRARASPLCGRAPRWQAVPLGRRSRR